MPDWRVDEDYQFTNGLNNHEWAWEFLRRNQEYIQDWESAVTAQALFEEFQSGSPFNAELNPHVVFSPPLPEGANIRAWSMRPDVHVSSPALFYGEKWQLAHHIQDPSLGTPPDFRKTPSAKTLSWDGLINYYSLVEDSSDLLIQNGKVAVVGIDLSRSISAIVKDITGLVKVEMKKRGIKKLGQKHFKKKDNWDVFLRVMDAQIAGASVPVMADILQPKQDLIESKVAIHQYIKYDIARLSAPETLVLLANEPD